MLNFFLTPLRTSLGVTYRWVWTLSRLSPLDKRHTTGYWCYFGLFAWEIGSEGFKPAVDTCNHCAQRQISRAPQLVVNSWPSGWSIKPNGFETIY